MSEIEMPSGDVIISKKPAIIPCLFCSFTGTKSELILHSSHCDGHPLWHAFKLEHIRASKLQADLAAAHQLIAAMEADDKNYEATFGRIALALGVDTGSITTFDVITLECERSIAAAQAEARKDSERLKKLVSAESTAYIKERLASASSEEEMAYIEGTCYVIQQFEARIASAIDAARSNGGAR